MAAASPVLAHAPLPSPSPAGALRQRVDAWQAGRQARREFQQYLAARPLVQQIYDEEARRETVAVAKGSMWIALGVAATNFSLAAVGNVANLVIGTVNLFAAHLAWTNQSSKVEKARGATISRALKLVGNQGSLAPSKEQIQRWLDAGLVRRGDLRSKEWELKPGE
jgi:hypothetical protein